jgi:nickel/cobalt exporter
MSVKGVAGARLSPSKLIVAIALIELVAGAADVVLAQGGPFGVPRPQAAPPAQADGVVGWILAKQAEFYKQFSGLIRAAKADGSAAWSLFGVSFLYGIFHAIGPGHGKAVISSYVVANEETWVRGVVLSFASAFLQALVAVTIVGVAAVLLNATAATMTRAVNVIEIVSYSLIILIGVRLLWVKGRGFISALRTLEGRPSIGAAAATPHHHEYAHHSHPHHDCNDHGHGAHHQHHRQHGAGHTHHDDDHASAWGHAHAPEPEQLAGPGGWQRGLSAIVAVGLRPCSGAIIVLVFSLAQGLFWAGIVSTFIMGLGTAITVAAIASVAIGAKAWARRFAQTRSGYGTLVMRGIEVTAAAAIIAFGALLLTGYVASERMVGM